MNKKARKANRRRWIELVEGLAKEGLLTSENTEGEDMHQRIRVTQGADAMLWETPEEDKTPVSKPCITCKRCNHCGAHHADQAEVPVYISGEVWAKIRLMMEHFTTHEWGGYFLADAEGTFIDMIIPNQEGRPSTWEADRGATEGLEIAGVIHSHVTMGVFHSKTDDENLIANFPISVVVSKKHSGELEFEAIRSEKMECGALYRYKAGVHMALPNQAEWFEQAKAKVRIATGFLTERASVTRVGQAIVTRGLCDKQRWCYRDKGHHGSCSENRENWLCRKTSYCVKVTNHDGDCSIVGSPITGRPAGMDQADPIPGSAWHPTHE
jgi:proteasome lid subunit RPN8/RPN11